MSVGRQAAIWAAVALAFGLTLHFLSGIMLPFVAGMAIAQDYPDRPIMLMVSYGAGGATDFQARIVTMTAGNHRGVSCGCCVITQCDLIIATSSGFGRHITQDACIKCEGSKVGHHTV